MAANITIRPAHEQGLFSAPPGIITQDWLDSSLFLGRTHSEPIIKSAYYEHVVQQCNMSTWLQEYTGYDTSCDQGWSIAEYGPTKDQIKVKTDTTIPAYPGTGVITLDAASHYVSGNFILPQVGNTIVSKDGYLLDVQSISVPSANNGSITVRIRDVNAGAQTITAGSQLFVLSGSALEDCECPKGQLAFRDLPILHDVKMIAFGDRAEMCGEALTNCQYLRIPFTDECGNVYDKWYTPALQDMYKRFEMRVHFERLFNDVFGIVHGIKSQGMLWTTDIAEEISIDDLYAWAKEISTSGLFCKEFAIFGGIDHFQMWQTFIHRQGLTNLSYTPFREGDCKWISMKYCGIEIAGLKLHIYEDCTFSNDAMLGGAGSKFPNAALVFPMCARQTNCRQGGGDTKMLTTVYHRDNNGRVWDNLTDSNGLLGPRNTFGAGCDQHEWTIKTKFLQELHGLRGWGSINLVA